MTDVGDPSQADVLERVLSQVLGWDKEEIGDEYYHLAALGNSGYDDYVQFMPGTRFVANLAMWLARFPKNKRRAAYKFVKTKLLFIGRAQMEQIVSTAYPNHVLPCLIKQIAEEKTNNFRFWEPEKILASDEFATLHDKCLFMGMSDGSHMDEFRRSSSRINHEQVTRTHEINQARADKMRDKLKLRTGLDEPRFCNVFLMDDFSASGTSYIGASRSGKISAFHDSIKREGDPLHDLVDHDNLKIHAILYVATENAVKTITKNNKQMLFRKTPFTVTAIHTIPDHVKFDESADPEFAALAKNPEYGHENIYDEHVTKENTPNPWLGFADCGLPIVLYHNTPNNSMPILWKHDDGTAFRGLFPRISRHQ